MQPIGFSSNLVLNRKRKAKESHSNLFSLYKNCPVSPKRISNNCRDELFSIRVTIVIVLLFTILVCFFIVWIVNTFTNTFLTETLSFFKTYIL